MNIGIIGVMILAAALLIAIAVIQKEFRILRERPFIFVLETVVISIVPAAAMFIFMLSRDVKLPTAMSWFWGLSVKFAIFHILFQVSGFYTHIFGI